MIIHQTLKNDTIIKCAITDLLNAGYIVVIRALAVDKITSLKDELGRGQREISLGRTARWVPPENHDTAYNGLPGTVGLIEEQGKFHVLEVVTRAENVNDINNIGVIYRKVNLNINLETKQVLEKYGFDINKLGCHSSAKEAVYAWRTYDADKTMETIYEQLDVMRAAAKTPEEKFRLKRLDELVQKYSSEEKDLKQKESD